LTGIPFKGIIRNIKEPKIIFNILFDYYVIKGNAFYYKGTISEMIFDIYKQFLLPKDGLKSHL